MNDLELVWESFDFYTSEICDYESKNMGTIFLIKNFHKNNQSPQKDQRNRLKKKYIQEVDALTNLYQKYIFTINQLLSYQPNEVSPLEREIDLHSLFALKNLTASLLQEIKISKSHYLQILS